MYPKKISYFHVKSPALTFYLKSQRNFSILSHYPASASASYTRQRVQKSNCQSRFISSAELRNSYNDIFKNVTESDAVCAVKDGLVAIHDSTGLPWAGTIVLTTLALRTLVTFPIGVYQQYILARLELVKVEMNDIVNELKRETSIAVRQFGWTEKEARAAFNASMKTQWRKLIERDNCHPLKSVLVVFIQLPAWILLSLALRCMSYAYVPDSENTARILGELNQEGWAWFTNLLVPDPTGLLPLSVSMINLAIIELQASTRAHHTRPQKIITNVFRGLAILSLPIALTVPSSMSLFWAVSSGLALTQNALLMSPRVRYFFRIPVTASQQTHPYANAWLNFKSKWMLNRLIIVRNPFSGRGQRYWISRCLRDFPNKPNKRNVDIDPAVNSIENLWSDYQEFKKCLRWVTLGYHHNWDTKVYTEDSQSIFPEDLALMCQHIAAALGFPAYTPQAAIVNFYHPGTTLSGHVDKSELDLEAPLISISFGQSAVFLIGGKTLDEEPTPILLQSGDILVMGQDARLSYHAVPRICAAATSPWQQYTPNANIDGCEVDLVQKVTDDIFWNNYDRYVQTNRINLNVRQVLPGKIKGS